MDSRVGRLRRLLGALLIIAAIVPASASAQASRTYVDRTSGSDVNDCLRETPCQTFQRAHDMTTPGGEVNAITTGNYSSVIINRPITIDGNGTQSTISPFGAAVSVNLPAGGKVVLRDLRINVAANLGGHGVDVVKSSTVVLDHVRIFGGSQAGIDVNHSGATSRLIVDDSWIHGSAAQGIRLAPTGGVVRATIRNSRIDDNGGAAVLLRPTSGGVARATVRASQIDANLNGIVAEAGAGGTSIANVFNSGITDSGIDPDGPGVGIYSNGANATVRIARNEIQHNKRGLQALNGGKILSARDNDVIGNITNGAVTGTWNRL
jgi:Right handed beta helix region